jgi:hypothetical protein
MCDANPKCLHPVNDVWSRSVRGGLQDETKENWKITVQRSWHKSCFG